MGTLTQHGYLCLADISGYTSYLAGVELEHAQAILADLLETIIGSMKPVLTVAKLEGDAVFAYALEARLPRSEMLLDLVEATYAAFSRQRESAQRHATCTCAACRAIPTLDLKFFVHHGDFIAQDISHTVELIGSDVNLAHRLMKNHITETTGWRAYALFTDRALEHMSTRPQGLYSQVETYEHLGDVQTYSLNLKESYEAMLATRHTYIGAAEADYILVQDFPAPPPIVWEWLTDPRARNRWASAAGVVWSAGVRPGGRTGPGARNHCAHGKGTSVETILDWQPFEYCSFETGGDGMMLLETMQFEPLADSSATRLHDHLQIKVPLPRLLRRLILTFLMHTTIKYGPLLAHSARMLADELAHRQAETAQT